MNNFLVRLLELAQHRLKYLSHLKVLPLYYWLIIIMLYIIYDRNISWYKIPFHRSVYFEIII